MSVSTLVPQSVVYTQQATSRVIESAQMKLDKALVRYDAWFLVVVAVILALGATVAAGLAVWCVVKQNKSFTGRWEFKNMGLRVRFECV
ncbi:hypothetical protein [Streptomyces sp. NPDC002054]|uniref:hypothetical protein n=1 Tax=Streptomyces sp. NPDC002054 TaxID=3154663 RepID=UPI003325563B